MDWEQILGPFGALVLAVLGIVGIYRIWREERADRKIAEANLAANTTVLNTISATLKQLVEDQPTIIASAVKEAVKQALLEDRASRRARE